MINCIEEVREGTVLPRLLKYAENTKRAQSLELSTYETVEKVHEAGVNSLDIETTEGRYLLSGGSNGSVYIHDLHNTTGTPKFSANCVGKVERTHSKHALYTHTKNVDSVQWYPHDTGIFTTSSMDKTLKVWDSNCMKPAQTFKLGANVYQHHMSPIATRHCFVAAALSSSQLRLVDLNSGATIQELKGHREPVLAVQWSPKDDNILASGGCDNKLYIWDIRSSRAILAVFDMYNHAPSSSTAQIATAHCGHVNGLCFTADGLNLVSFGSDDRLRVWDMLTGRNTNVNFGKVFNINTSKAVKLDVSRDCSYPVLYVPSENKIKAFDLTTGVKIDNLIGHYDTVNCCQVRPHFSDELFSGASDRNLLIWTAKREQYKVYERSLREQDNGEMVEGGNRTAFWQRRPLTTDTWSDDED